MTPLLSLKQHLKLQVIQMVQEAHLQVKRREHNPVGSWEWGMAVHILGSVQRWI